MCSFREFRALFRARNARSAFARAPCGTFAILSRVNKPVCFVVTAFREKDGQRICGFEPSESAGAVHGAIYFQACPGDVIDAVVTRMEPFGAFCDIGAGISALLPIDAISVFAHSAPQRAVLHRSTKSAWWSKARTNSGALRFSQGTPRHMGGKRRQVFRGRNGTGYCAVD